MKDFDHFEDGSFFEGLNSDDLFSNAMFLMKGQKWRDMRSTMSPAFTGSKMRQMFELTSECADELLDFLQSRAKNGEALDFEMKDFFSRHTNDVIASCAFGLKVNSFADPNNEFLVSGKKLMNFLGATTMLKIFFLRVAPRFGKVLGIEIMDSKVEDFFRSMVFDTMDERERQNIFRPDMINILMQLRKGSTIAQQTVAEEKNEANIDGFATVEESSIGKSVVKRKWTDNELISQAFVFFFAGFEFNANTLTTLAYELVVNPEVQQKLYEEIKETHESRQGKRIDYDTLLKMKYMDQVVTEALRKWPSSTQLDRMCVKDYVYDDGDLKLNIKKGTSVLIPVYGIHHDPQYYPNPERFDPERFSDENKANIVPGSFLPFGIGPRNCIGMWRIKISRIDGIKSSQLFRSYPSRLSLCIDVVESCHLSSSAELQTGSKWEDRNSNGFEEDAVHYPPKRWPTLSLEIESGIKS